MTTSFNLHDCAAKRLESDAMAAQLAEHLANGGTVTVVPGYAPKARPAHFNFVVSKRQEHQAQVLQYVKNGADSIASIAAKSGLSIAIVSQTLNALLRQRRVVMTRFGNKRIWNMEDAA